MPQAFTPDYIATLVSVGFIAKANGHSRMAVYNAIERLEIKPILTTPHRLYAPEVVSTLRDAMRFSAKEAC